MARSVVDIFPVSPPPPPSSVGLVAIYSNYSENPQPPRSRYDPMFISEMADSRRRCGYAMGGDKMGRQATLTRPPQKTPGAPTWRTGSIVLELINRPTNHQDSLWRRAALICATEPPRMGLGLGLPLALSALCLPPPLGALSTAHKQSQ